VRFYQINKSSQRTFVASLGRIWAAIAILVIVSMGAIQLRAQSTTSGDIVGIITDPSGAVLTNVQVTETSQETGATQTQSTNSSGAFRFALLPPGRYMISVAAKGFQSTNISTVVTVGQTSSVTLALNLSSASETMEVSADAPLLQTENADVSTNFNEKQLSLVPNPGNDLSYIAETAPGVVQNTQGGQGNFSVHGLPATSNLFTVDGQNENDPFLNLNNSGATNLLLGNNDIGQATVVTNGYSGQYGTLAGANVNYVTKAGSNTFHGNALYWWNGRALNANSFFNNQSGTPRPFVNANQWAASLGGPVFKNKTFFFVNTEGLRFVLPTSINARIPSPQFEAATLANLANVSPASVPFYNSIFNLFNNAPGASRAADVLAPGTDAGGNPTGNGCQSFNGLGSPNIPCALAFNSSNGQLSTEWLLTARIDQNIGSNDRMFAHFRTDHGTQATLTDAISPLFNLSSNQPQYEGQLEESHTFGTNAVNQFIASGQWYSASFNVPNLPAALQAIPFRLAFAGGAFSSLGRLLSSVPQGRNVTQYQIVDDFSLTKGAHSLKFGLSFRRNDITDLDPGIGSIGASEGTSLSNFFSGLGGNYFQSFPSQPKQPIALYGLGFYGQDEWSIHRNLKLTLSLRGEHFSNPVCQTDCFARLSGDFLNVSHDPNQPYNQAIVFGQHQALPNYTAIEWLPRVGFTWSPFGRTGMVVSGGFGLFADSFPGVVADNLLSNAPLQAGFSISGAPLSPDVTGNQAQQAAQNNAAFLAAFANGGTLQDLQNAVPGFSPPTINNVARRVQNPRYQQWNLQVQQALGSKMSVSLNYTGNHGIHEVVQNPSLNAFCDQACLTALNNGNAPTVTQFADLPVAQPDQRFSNVTEISTAAVSNYNGLTASVTRRSNSLIVQANYTYSHALDEISNGGVLQFGGNTNFSPINSIDPFNLRSSYGNADYDTRHYFNLNYVYSVPHKFGPAAAFAGWTISGTAFARSGLPFTVVDGNAFAVLQGTNYGFPNLTSVSVPAAIVGSTSQSCTGSASNPSTPCLALSSFAPAVTGFGTQRRNQFTGPTYFNTDLAISKSFKIPRWEGANVAVGAQFFNILNHPHFDQPNADISSPQFGTITSSVSSPTSIFGSFLGADASPRLIQLHASLTF